MIPQADDYPEAIRVAIQALLEGGVDVGRQALEPIQYRVRAVPSRPGISREVAARIYVRDHFICRYRGGKTILTPAMELLASIYADIFPFHRNWKGGLTHPAIVSRSAVVDHVNPSAWGGDWLAESNLATACWPCNARKGDLTMDQLGWTLREPTPEPWDGLTGYYPALWEAAGRPNPAGHQAWMRCLKSAAEMR